MTARRRLAAALLGGGSIALAMVPSCADDDCTVGALAITENAPSFTDRLCGAADGESLATAITTTCELAQCQIVCPTITPRNPDDVVTVVWCQHTIPGRPPTSSSATGAGGAAGFTGIGGAGGEPIGGMGGDASSTGGTGSIGGTGGTGGAAAGAGAGGATTGLTWSQKPHFVCNYEVETLFCSP